MAVFKGHEKYRKVDEVMAEKIARLTTKAIFQNNKETFLMLMKFMIWLKIN